MKQYTDLFYLVSVTSTKDKHGIDHKTECIKTVHGNVLSASAAEFFAAGENDKKAGATIEMHARQYAGQKTVMYKGKRYDVYRTYKPAEDVIELHVSEKVGT